MRGLFHAEARLLQRDHMLAVTLLILAVSLAFGAVSGAAYRSQWQQTAISLEQQSRARLDGQIAALGAGTKVDHHAPGRPGTPASVNIAVPAAVPPLAHFSIGQSDLYPRSADVGLGSRVDTMFKQYQIQSPLTLASGRFDLAYVVVAILPLLAIVLCFDLVATDRAIGRLSLLAVQAGNLKGLVWRRLALRGALLSLPVILLFAWGLISGAPLLPLLSWISVALLYCGFWLLLCAMIAVRPVRPAVSAAQLVALWLLIVLALPAGINRLIEQVAPPPSQQAFDATFRDAEARAYRKAEELLEGYLSDHPELTANGIEQYADWMKKAVVVRQTVEAETQPVIATYEAVLAHAQRAAQVLQFLSPAAAVQVGLSDAAGTGPDQQMEYVSRVRAYKQALQARLVPPLYQGLKLKADELASLPVFTARSWTPAHGGLLLVATVAYLLALWAWLFWRLTRAIARLSPIRSS
jgi:ABC-2 type transport system permease protein